MKVHFIAIGGAVMHNLAIALHKKGVRVSGSDDEIFDPSRSRLKEYGLLPFQQGWDEDRITADLDAVILGMHARKDNPELKKAMERGIRIYSFPEFLYEQTRDKKRVVIAGSHGKTTITSMVMHVLKKEGFRFDYMVGSAIEGFETMVGFEKESQIAVFEGDEYLSSPLDPRPKFAHYKPHITLITGIAWDHINVYPDYREYKRQFCDLAMQTASDGELIYFSGDEELSAMIENEIRGKHSVKITQYSEPEYSGEGDKVRIKYSGRSYPLNLIGKHNVQNMQGALLICRALGIDKEGFLNAMTSFRGAARRQELLYSGEDLRVYLDFAHAPSKVRSTVAGFREMFPGKKLTTFLELHTFSSLNRTFIPHYRDCLEGADEAFIFYDPSVVEHKNLPKLDPEYVRECFGKDDAGIITEKEELNRSLHRVLNHKDAVILIMTSGNLGGTDLPSILRKRSES